jgi:hypothetical protein
MSIIRLPVRHSHARSQLREDIVENRERRAASLLSCLWRGYKRGLGCYLHFWAVLRKCRDDTLLFTVTQTLQQFKIFTIAFISCGGHAVA